MGTCQRDSECPGNRTSKDSGIWLHNFHRTRGNKDSSKAQTKSFSNKDSGERSSDPKRDWALPACECLKVFYGGMCWPWPAPGWGVLAEAVLRGISWCKSFLEFTNRSTIEPADYRTGSTQAKQLTGRENIRYQQTIVHTSQQDPLWPTSQNIGNKSKNKKKMGPN